MPIPKPVLRIELEKETLDVGGFIPISISEFDGYGLFVTWSKIANFEKSRNFFDSYVMSKIRLNDERERLISPIRSLLQIPQRTDEIPSTSVLLHSSRCGSTAISNIAQLERGTISLREPQIFNDFDTLVDQSKSFSDCEKGKILKGLFSAFAQFFSDRYSNVLIKLSSRSTFHASRYTTTLGYKNVAYLMRNPNEILNSLALRQSDFTRSNPNYICELFEALDLIAGKINIFDYETVFSDNLSGVARQLNALNISISKVSDEQLKRELRRYSKDPTGTKRFDPLLPPCYPKLASDRTLAIYNNLKDEIYG